MVLKRRTEVRRIVEAGILVVMEVVRGSEGGRGGLEVVVGRPDGAACDDPRMHRE